MPVGRIAYINFEQHHGGIIVNVSQGGLCLHSIVPVPATKTIRFWLLEQGVRIEGEGRLVWTAESQKRGGLCFANISSEARDKLCELANETAGPAIITAHNARREEAQPHNRRSLPISVSSIRPFRGFLGGLALGIAISALVTSAFVSHRQLGVFLIRLGERLGAKVAAPAPASGGHSETLPTVEPQKLQPAPHPPERKSFSEEATRAAPGGPLVGPRPAIQPESQPATGKSDPRADGIRSLDDGTSTAQPPAMTIRAADLLSLLSPDAVIAPPPDAVPDGPGRISPPMPANQVIVENGLARPENIGLTEQKYFEVGKFKQQFSAQGESDKLAGLGFPATVLGRGGFWQNSYRVLVGPYQFSEEAEEAYRNLVLLGFEVRPFEKGTRNFALPAHLTLHGIEIPVGDCDISWESYINDVRVKFEQDNSVVARAEGKWESRDPKYERSATVYIQNRNGSRTLVELRFGGMSRALAFR